MSENKTENDKKETEPAPYDPIRETGSVLTDSGKGKIECLTIIGQIEGHYLLGDNAKTTKYEHVIPLLAAVEESADVEAGLAIAELISGMRKPTASVVLGGGHSIGVPLAVSARRSFIVPSATMTIHPVRTNGLVVGVEQSFEYLRRMQERINGFILKNSRISPERLERYLMSTDEMATDVGTVIDGVEAVESGLIDEVGGLSSALSWLHSAISAGSTLAQ